MNIGCGPFEMGGLGSIRGLDFEGWKEFEIVSVRGLGYKAVKKI